jgi:hypothetical protein
MHVRRRMRLDFIAKNPEHLRLENLPGFSYTCMKELSIDKYSAQLAGVEEILSPFFFSILPEATSFPKARSNV